MLVETVMSYSRWINSYWYTFWSANPAPNGEEKGEQLFDVDCQFSFTFKQLTAKDGIKKSINKIKKETRTRTLKPGKNDFLELQGYMKLFIQDVKEQYRSKK